jgi:hypothetical protein
LLDEELVDVARFARVIETISTKQSRSSAGGLAHESGATEMVNSNAKRPGKPGL